MYAREVHGRKLTFAVSGLLWNRSLVMLDMETRSEWSHIIGDCRRGAYHGTRLEQTPAVMTDWASWRAAHPDTTCVVLNRSSVEYTTRFQQQPGRFVIGLPGVRAKAWAFDDLAKGGGVNDEFEGDPVAVVYDPASTTARVYLRAAGGRVLTFRAEAGRVTDDETESTWDVVTGRATAGPLTGTRLRPHTAFVSYTAVWRGFHPKGVIVGE